MTPAELASVCPMNVLFQSGVKLGLFLANGRPLLSRISKRMENCTLFLTQNHYLSVYLLEALR